jgi:hypothetical protein
VASTTEYHSVAQQKKAAASMRYNRFFSLPFKAQMP